MTTKEKFEQLKALELNSKSNRAIEKIQLDFERLAMEDPRGFEEAFLESAKRTLSDVKQLRIKEQLCEMSEIVSMSYIAKTYFHKTKSWLSQRINELNVNGKVAQFTADELNILNEAFEDISKKIGAFRVSR